MANPSWVQGKSLHLTVVGGVNLNVQDPYVCIEHGNQRFQTRTCKGGHKNPSFGDNFTIKLITGIPDISFEVWNSKNWTKMSKNCLIGRGKIELTKVLSEGFDDRSLSLLSDKGRTAGDLKVIMRFEDSEKEAATAAAAAAAPPTQLQPWLQYCPPFRLPYAACLPFAPYEEYHPQQPPQARPPPPPQDVYHNVYYPPPQQHVVAPPPQQPPLPPYGYPQGQPYQPCPPSGASYPYGFCPPRGY